MSNYPTIPQQSEGEPINNWVRIGLRVLGALMLVAGAGFLVLVVVAGPDTIGEWMGQNCVTGDPVFADAEACTWQDVLEFVPAAGILALVGAVLVLVMRRPKPAGRAESSPWG